MLFINSLSCSFTGHRPNKFKFGYDEASEDFLRLYDALYCQVERLVEAGVSIFYSGMALGVDQWGAQVVLQLKQAYPHIKLVAVLPCETQANKWSSEMRHRYYDEILSNADDTIFISKPYTQSCMMERNRYLVEHCDYLLAVYDGVNEGGTAYTVQYAREQRKKMVIIQPDTLEAIMQ